MYKCLIKETHVYLYSWNTMRKLNFPLQTKHFNSTSAARDTQKKTKADLHSFASTVLF